MSERIALSKLYELCQHCFATPGLEYSSDGRLVERITVYSYPSWRLTDTYDVLRDEGLSPKRVKDGVGFYLEIPVDRIDCRY
jgi:hypothetical protein